MNGNDTLKIECINELSKVPELAPIWDTLLAESDVDFPFLTLDWITFWWQAFGHDSKMLILIIKEYDEVIAIAPLRKTKMRWRGLTVTAISFIANYYSNRTGLIIGNKAKDRKDIFYNIIKYLKEGHYHFDLLCLDLIEQNSRTDSAVNEALRLSEMKYRKMSTDSSPYMFIDKDWDSYFKTRSRNFRSKLNRTRNELNRQGAFEIIKYSAGDVSSAMQEVISVSKKTWKYKKNTAIASKKESLSFFTDLAKKASEKGWLNLWVLKLFDKPLSFVYNLMYKEKIYFLKVGFDEDYSKLSPGLFLTEASIKDAFINKYEVYDFLGENENYKLKWTSLCRDHCKYWIFNDTLCGNFLFFWESVIITIIKKIVFKYIIKRNGC